MNRKLTVIALVVGVFLLKGVAEGAQPPAGHPHPIVTPPASARDPLHASTSSGLPICRSRACVRAVFLIQ